jgi:DNA-binding CsgD family transcriptional regulator
MMGMRSSGEILRRAPRAMARRDARVDIDADERAAVFDVHIDDDHDADVDAAALIAEVERAAFAPLVPAVVIPQAWGLTPAEARVVDALVAGRTVREIADGMAVSVETTRTHVKRVLHKAGVRRQAELIARLRR